MNHLRSSIAAAALAILSFAAPSRGVQDRSATVALLKKACAAMDARGCFDLGLWLEKEPPSSLAVVLKDAHAYEEGCDAGDASDCYELAAKYSPSLDPLLSHWHLKADPDRAAALYRRAAELAEKSCEAGNAAACFQVGTQHRLGLGVPQDVARAMRPLSQACSADVAQACSLLGILYRVGPGTATDVDAACDAARSSLLAEACAADFPEACAKLAAHSDPEKAVPLYRQACDGHVASACTDLGYRYSLGQGVPADAERSRESFAQGCDAGDKLACYEVAEDYSLRWDKARAASFFQKSCDLGLAQSCFNLGHAYLAGSGVPKDEVRAAELYKRGCFGLSSAERERRKECQ